MYLVAAPWSSESAAGLPPSLICRGGYSVPGWRTEKALWSCLAVGFCALFSPAAPLTTAAAAAAPTLSGSAELNAASCRCCFTVCFAVSPGRGSRCSPPGGRTAGATRSSPVASRLFDARLSPPSPSPRHLAAVGRDATRWRVAWAQKTIAISIRRAWSDIEKVWRHAGAVRRPFILVAPFARACTLVPSLVTRGGGARRRRTDANLRRCTNPLELPSTH